MEVEIRVALYEWVRANRQILPDIRERQQLELVSKLYMQRKLKAFLRRYVMNILTFHW